MSQAQSFKDKPDNDLKKYLAEQIECYSDKLNVLSPLIGEASQLRLYIMDIVVELYKRKLVTEAQRDLVDITPPASGSIDSDKK